MPEPAPAASDSKLLRQATQRTVSAMSRWAVPMMLAAIVGLLKSGYDGFVGEFQKLRSELSATVDTLNDTRWADLASIDARLEKHGADSQRAQAERLAHTERLATAEATIRRNTEWINRADSTMTNLREDVAAIRAVLEIKRKPPAPAVDLGRIPMLLHF